MGVKTLIWKGDRIVDVNELPADQNQFCEYYKHCTLDKLNLDINDFVFISNVDSLNDAQLAQILFMYENPDYLTNFTKRYRIIVQWYERPKQLPNDYLKGNELNIDFDREIIADQRKRRNDIPIEQVLSKFNVLFCDATQPLPPLSESLPIENNNLLKMYVCRYMLIKDGGRYNLVPQQYSTKPNNVKQLENKENTPTKVTAPRRTRTISTATRKTPSQNKQVVTPIRIVKNSVQKVRRQKVIISSSSEESEDAELSSVSPKKKARHGVERLPTNSSNSSESKGVRRNLSLSLNNESNKEPMANYSIIEQQITNGMKLKLKLTNTPSKSHNSVDLTASSLGNICLNDPCTPFKLKSCTVHLVKTPICNGMSTPTKSILKLPSNRNPDTPKRNVILSNLIEEQEINGRRRSVRHSTRTPIKKSMKEDTDSDFEPSTPKSIRKRRTTTTTTTPTATKPITPATKLRMIRAGTITPSMTNRENPLATNRRSNLQLAKESLHVSAVPKSLPCRENEYNNILSFIECKIIDECGGCMYVSGVPGTGKTATVTEVIRALKQKASTKEIPKFDFISINGMQMTEPRQAYVHIYKQLTEKTIPWEQAHALLEKRFSMQNRKTTVLLVDELDILCNRRQDVVYNLLDWPTKMEARLVVVTIANTMDLPERLLMGKVTSRLGLTRLTFQPYSHKQLQEVVTARLAGTDIFKSESIQLVARKVASVSGDCRRALDICRRATEIAEASAENTKTSDILVSMEHVQQAFAEMITSSKVRAIKSCSKMEQMFLQAVAAEVTRTGVEETTFLGVYIQFESIAALMGVSMPPTPGRAMLLCCRLGAMKLLLCEHSRADVYQKILLNVSADDIHYALSAKL